MEKKKYVYVPKVYEQRNVYDLEMQNDDGTTSIWKYNKKKNPYGPYQTIVKYPVGYSFYPDAKIPKSKQKYTNPKTGKEVSYARAKNLGLI
jgi:hypothetical protein